MVTALFVALLGQIALDSRGDVYPSPPVESRHLLRVDLGDGVTARLVGAGAVDSTGKVKYWDVNGRIDPKMGQVIAKLVKERHRARFVPHGPNHRFVLYTFDKIGTKRLSWSAWGGGQFAGFFEHDGRHYFSRLLLNAGATKSLSIFIDKTIHATATVPPRVGATAKIGRGSIRITRIKDLKGGAFNIWVDAKGDTFESILFTPLDRSGKVFSVLELDNQGRPTGRKNPNIMRNGLGHGINTLAMGPAAVAMDRRYVANLSLTAPYVRRYLLYGAPANPRKSSPKR